MPDQCQEGDQSRPKRRDYIDNLLPSDVNLHEAMMFKLGFLRWLSELEAWALRVIDEVRGGQP